MKRCNTIQTKLNSLNRRELFGSITLTPSDVRPVGYKWVFVKTRNGKNEVKRYKAHLVAQGFSQRPEIDYEETYSSIMNAITFRFLMSLAYDKNLEKRLMDVVKAYLSESLDTDIYMKVPYVFKMPEALNFKPKELCAIKL